MKCKVHSGSLLHQYHFICYLLRLQVTICWISPLLNRLICMVPTCELYLRAAIIPLKGSLHSKRSKQPPHAYPKPECLPGGVTPGPVFQCTLFSYKIMLVTVPLREALGHFLTDWYLPCILYFEKYLF